MTIESLIILFIIGLTAGFLAGYFGIGGGVIIVPSLLLVYSLTGFDSDYKVHIAIATSLFTIIFTTISSSYKHSKNKNIIWRTAFYIGIASALSVFIFSMITVGIPGDTLKKIFSTFLILVSIKMFFSKANGDDTTKPSDIKVNVVQSVLIGLTSGIVSAFTGLGGGIIVVPMMHYFLKFSIKRSIGTSSAAILLTAISGALGYFLNVPEGAVLPEYSLGLVDVLSAIPVVIGSIPMSQLGAHLHKKSSPKLLLKLFSIFVFIVAVLIIIT